MRSGALAAITTAAGSSVRAASVSESSGVSGPRKVIRQPRSRKREAEDDERQIVLFPRRTGQESAWPGALIPAAGEAEEPPPEEVAGEVLVGNRRLASLPAVAQLAQVRQDHIAEDRLQGQVRQQPVDCHVRGCLVETVQRLPQAIGAPRESRGVIGAALSFLEGPARGLCG